MTADDRQAVPRPGEPYQIVFTDVQIQVGGGTFWTLRRCGRCMALVMDDRDSMHGHADWHGQLRSETAMASLGFGGLGL